MFPDRARIFKKSRAFTLIELMVVVFIIGILIAAVLVGVPKIKKAVAGTQTQAQLSAIAGAIQQYYNDYKAYPGPIANNQLGAGYDNGTAPFVGPPSSPIPLKGTTGSSSNPVTTMAPSADATGLDSKYITGGENLVLGICGGLRVVTNPAPGFEYHPEDLFALDGTTPAPRGPASLNPNYPKKQLAYITLKAGDLSVPNKDVNGGLFTDAAGRYAHDSMIPELMDKYSDPLPFLYYRTNVGGTAIVGFRNLDKLNGSALVDPTTNGFGGTNPNQIAQYDLLQNFGYVDNTTGRPEIGVIASNTNSMHGLIGLDNTGNLSFPLDTIANNTSLPGNQTSPGMNAIAYFKDPSLNAPYDPTVTNPPSNVHLGVARQKDGYILISAGADRQYGTHDDQVFPGPLQP